MLKIYSVYDFEFDTLPHVGKFKVSNSEYTHGCVIEKPKLALKMYRMWGGAMHSMGGPFIEPEEATSDRLYTLIKGVVCGAYS